MFATVAPGAFHLPFGQVPATDPTAYFDVTTGELQLDPAGDNIVLFNFTYNTVVANITGSTPGPFVYPYGTLTDAVSTATTPKTFPAGTWSTLTTFPARIAGTVSLTNSPTLATSGPNTASTTGWFNRPWSFGGIVAPKSLTVDAAQKNFIAITPPDAPTDIGYGVGRGLFQYVVSGVTGLKYGPVVIVSSPDPNASVQSPNAIIGQAGESEFVISRSTGTSFATTPLATLPSGTPWATAVVGDFNGDGRSDVASETNAGAWWVSLTPASGTGTPTPWATLASFQFPTVGDFNGDGRSDIAVRNAANGNWRVLTSSGTAFSSTQWGNWASAATWDNVRAGDFNGDGKSDLVGQRTSDGAWHVSLSTGSSFTTSAWAYLSSNQFATVGDYNGDGRSDVAVRNAANGNWRVLTSSGTAFSQLPVGQLGLHRHLGQRPRGRLQRRRQERPGRPADGRRCVVRLALHRNVVLHFRVGLSVIGPVRHGR